MYDPVSGRLLSHPLLYQGLLGPEQLHGQLVVRGLEDVLQLVPHPAGLGVGADADAPGGALGGGGRGHLLLGRAVQAHVVLLRAVGDCETTS